MHMFFSKNLNFFGSACLLAPFFMAKLTQTKQLIVALANNRGFTRRVFFLIRIANYLCICTCFYNYLYICKYLFQDLF